MSDLLAALAQHFAAPAPALHEGVRAAVRPLVTANDVDNPNETFLQYLARVRPNIKQYPHVVRAAHVLQRVADGELKYVIVEWPPRHGKSEEFSRAFTAYFLHRFPWRTVALGCYGAELAEELSADAQENFTRGGGKVHPKFSAHRAWKTLHGGGMWACGIRGPAAGRGFNLGIIDDPVKDEVESASLTTGRRNQNWWRSVWYNRGQPDGDFQPAYVVIMTRWPGPGDLVGWLLQQEGTDDDDPLRWHVVSWEAIREPDEQHEQLPASCTREDDPREVGTALCEERVPLRRLNRIRKRIGPYFWASLFQQRPTPQEGGSFKREDVEHEGAYVYDYQVPAPRCPDISYWDEGSSGDMNSDLTCRVKLRFGIDSKMYVLHVAMEHLETDARRRFIKNTSELDGFAVTQVTQQEPARAGKDAALDFRRMLQAFPVYTEPATGSKAVRGRPVEAAVAAHLIKMVKGPWNKAFVDSLVSTIWDVTVDDPAECLASAYNWQVRRPLQDHGRQPTIMGLASRN